MDTISGRFKRLFGAQDMTVGKPVNNILRFSVPLLIGNVVQLMYSTVDSIVVGQYVGDNALAGLGASMPILNLMLVLFMGLATGSSIMVSQLFGAKQRDDLSKTIGTTITLSALVSIFVMAVGVLVTGPILNLTNPPLEVRLLAEEYLVISFLTIAGPVFYNMVAGILRGFGDSVMPLVYLVVACVTNIVLDLLFVMYFGWGVAGVAWATAIAQALSAVLCMLKLLRLHHLIDIKKENFRINPRLTKQLVRLGLPSGLTQGTFSIAMLLLQGLTNTFGTTYIAVHTVVMRVDNFVMMPSFTFATAMTTYTGQNIGAGRLDRVKEGTRKGMWIGVLTSIALTILLLFFGPNLMRLFTTTDEVVAIGAVVLRILAFGNITISINQVLGGVLRGAGETVAPMWIAMITTGLRVLMSYGLVALTKTELQPQGEPMMMYYSMLTAWVLGAVLAVFFYFKGGWKQKAVVVRAAETPAPAEAQP